MSGREYRNPRNVPLEHPVEALRSVAEGVAAATGRQVDHESFDAARAYLDEPVDPDGCGLPQTERRGDWMQTHTGRQYWPLDPRAAEVDVADIVHHLSMLCRYCGACSRFYSVLEHSLGVAFVAGRAHKRTVRILRAAGIHTNAWVGRAVKLWAQFHDAPEAYVHDLIRPIKRCVQGYAEVEALNDQAIAEALDLPTIGAADWALIKAADNAMLLAEQAVLMAPAPAEWAPLDIPAAMRADADAWLRRARWMPWRRSRWWLKRTFLRLHRELAE